LHFPPARPSVSIVATNTSSASIRLRGVRQNNLKGFDLDVPLGKYIVVTGLSGAGKSSLVFETLHAEGQRRYVETFSTYTRQFLELLDKPRVDSIENIRPSIAIEQTNTVRTSRSTVGTMTELTDFFKVWFSHVAQCFDPETGDLVEDDDPRTIWKKTLPALAGSVAVIAFRVTRPGNLPWGEILSGLTSQGYTRALLEDGRQGFRAARIDSLPGVLTGPSSSAPARHGRRQGTQGSEAAAPVPFVVQDRLVVAEPDRSRFVEAAETALHFGRGEIFIFRENPGGVFSEAGRYSRGLHSPRTGRTFRPATPALFSFNSPLGACPRCRGFGRMIDVDYRLAIPDHSLSIDDGAIKPWEGQVYGESKKDLYVFARRLGIPTGIPFADLKPEHRDFVVNGDPGYGTPGKEWPNAWYGLKGFFRYLETKTYKMHVRVFLSRYRAYNACPDCGGSRLQPEALCWKWQGRTLPQLYQHCVSDLLGLVEGAAARRPQSPAAASSGAHSADIALDSIITRLRYLQQVGLGYLTLDRPSRTLSGGEVERVNLTSCLGTSLVDTLFVLDEPSVGLHPRDIARLIGVIRSLTAAGNTVVVVEHDESMIRAADEVIEIGPEPGRRGGHLVFQGTVDGMLASPASLTGAYLSGRRHIEVPKVRRSVVSPERAAWLSFHGVSKHNISGLDFRFPLRRFVCLSGVSGSGKSTLLDNVIYQGLLRLQRQPAEDPAAIGEIRSDIPLGEVVLVDQSPLSRTPRSNPALYTEAWELIRSLYASTPAAEAAGLTAGSFSFNSGDGRCEHCEGLGFERIEMQFLSDVFVPCAVCGGRRFKPEVLAVAWNGRSVADLLGATISDAQELFADQPEIRRRLGSLADVGLGYLTLGQPLNTLSGGEAQRLKLVRYLGAFSGGAAESPPASGALLLLDEPTTGLHKRDVQVLLAVLQRLVDRGHSIVVIEHNLDVLMAADWILEIGPDAGAQGGRVVAEGTPEAVAASATATAPYLRAALAGIPVSPGAPAAASRPAAGADRELTVVGARENNLKNLSVAIPHHALSVVTGVSGSGKSTLAFDIVFAEGQRRFMESMSTYARLFVEQLPRPLIDRLTGIPPTVAIEQRVTRGSRKSIVATITEVAPYLRLLYARLGVQHHPETDRPVVSLSPARLRRRLAEILAFPAARRAVHLHLCAPVIRGRKGHHQPVATWIGRQGCQLMRVDGRLLPVERFARLDRYREHDIEAVVADLGRSAGLSGKETAAALDRALELGRGACFLLGSGGKILAWLSTTRTDAVTGESFPELDPKHFSFNSPKGWCPACRGHGRLHDWMLKPRDDEDMPPEIADLVRPAASESGDEGRLCHVCHGERLNRIARAVKLPLRGRPPASLPALLRLPPAGLLGCLRRLDLDARGHAIVHDILPQIESRLRFLDHVGLGYLSLDRPTETLSGGEAQRIRLAAQLGSNLSGVLYVLDEPTIGLHARDNERLVATLESLRDKGNTLLVVEHDETMMEHADRIIDLGPGAGPHGGEIIANDTPRQLKRNHQSLTGLYLNRGLAHPFLGRYREIPSLPAAAGKRRSGGGDGWLRLSGARHRNLRDVDLRLPLGRLIMVCGPSGAGKSTLCGDLLGPAVAAAVRLGSRRLSGAAFARAHGGFEMFASSAPAHERPPPPFNALEIGGELKAVIEVDQAPIGKTPRSTPATYLGVFDQIREFFASLPASRMRGYTASRFSFNTAGGRCGTCLGAGRVKLEMSFMPDTYLPCEDCGGGRYGPELADIAWKGRTVAQVLGLTFEEAAAFFDFHARIAEICRLMCDCGLGYLTLGQSSPTLSGGEAQRLKLVSELARGLQTHVERSRGVRPRNLYLLEEPTIGLHLSDCERLIRLLQGLVDQGHTVVVIEHHLDLLAEADYLVELGPGGGPDGGRILYQGPVAKFSRLRRSPTAPYLRPKLGPTAR